MINEPIEAEIVRPSVYTDKQEHQLASQVDIVEARVVGCGEDGPARVVKAEGERVRRLPAEDKETEHR